MKLLNLPTDILLHLLNTQFSLQDLLNLRRLCPQVCHLIESRHCIGRRHSLKLFWSFSDIQRYTLDLYYLCLEDVSQLRLKNIHTSHSDDLVLNGTKFSVPTCDLLIRLLPRLEHLTIYFTHTNNYPDYLILRHMFAQLSGQLTGLSLFGWFNHSTCDNFGKDAIDARLAMAEAINQCTSLKHLDMCLENLFKYDYKVLREGQPYISDEITLPANLNRVIPQLVHLTFCYRSLHFQKQIVRKLGPQCTTLRLHRVKLPNHDALLDKLKLRIRDHNPSFSVGLKHLQLSQQYYSPGRNGYLLQVLSKPECFAQLHTLELVYCGEIFAHRYKGPDMKELLSKLVPLKQLTGLTLMGLEIESFESEIVVLPVLSRITRLSINSGNRELKNQDSWFCGLCHAFPSVQRLTVAFKLNYTIDPAKHLSRNFVQCTHYRQLHLYLELDFKDMRHTLPSALARHHRRRFRRQDGHEMHCIEQGMEENGHEAEQQWTRRSGDDQWIKVVM